MTIRKFPSLAELTTPSVQGVTSRQCARDRDIDRFNADRSDGRVAYGNRHFRNGKQFYINDSSNSPFRKHNRERIFDFFDAQHNDPETTDMPYRDVALRGRWDLPRHLSDEQMSDSRQQNLQQTAVCCLPSLLPDYHLLVERADVLRAYCCHYPTNSYLEWIIKNPDEIGGRWRYMSLRDSDGSIDWLKGLLRRQILIRVLKPKLAAVNSS